MAADLPRRALLGMGAAAVVAGLASGCGTPALSSPEGREVGSRGPAGQDLATAAAGERRLIAAYDDLLPLAAGSQRRLLRRLRAQHVAHLSRLEAPATTIGARRIRTAADLSRLEATSSHQLARQAVGLTDGGTAALLASLAASHAGHAQALQGMRLALPYGHRRTDRSRRSR